MAEPQATQPQLHICFVCTGNICRSPIAEVVMRDALAKEGLLDAVNVSSCGLGGWHVGQKADPRALAELDAHGHDATSFRAHQYGPADADADLLVALATNHVAELVARGAVRDKVVLLRDFDPEAGEHASVADPYYGGPQGFRVTYEEVCAAIPGIVRWIRTQLGESRAGKETQRGE